LVSPSASYSNGRPWDRPAILSPGFFSSNSSEAGGQEGSVTSDVQYQHSEISGIGYRRPFSGYSSGADTPLNLGAESPGSILNPAMTPIRPLTPNAEAWKDSGIAAVPSDIPTRSKLWRSASFERRKKGAAKLKQDDEASCGICFQLPIKPRKMKCCGSVYCLEDITNWLYGSSSDGRCPSCKKFFFEPSRPSTPQTPTTEMNSLLFEEGPFSDSDSDSDDALTTASSPSFTEDKGKSAVFTLSGRPEDHTYERFISTIVLMLVLALLIKWA
jgi:hypothetical protein